MIPFSCKWQPFPFNGKAFLFNGKAKFRRRYLISHLMLLMRNFVTIIILLFFNCSPGNKYPPGGFDYPSRIASEDTNLYYYPLKEVGAKQDAFLAAFIYLDYELFDEPNLSIKAQPDETYRLTYSTGFGETVIIRFTEKEMTIKKGNPWVTYAEDTSHLNNSENFHFKLMERWYPFDKAGRPASLSRYLDSLTKLYPVLLDPKYYRELRGKTIVKTGEKFSYTSRKVQLTKRQHDSIIQQITSSGFWNMDYKVKCQNPTADGYGFTLEANTKTKYKIVIVEGCPRDKTAFTGACQKLIEFANLDDEINLIWSGEIITPPVDWDSIYLEPIDVPDLK